MKCLSFIQQGPRLALHQLGSRHSRPLISALSIKSQYHLAPLIMALLMNLLIVLRRLSRWLSQALFHLSHVRHLKKEHQDLQRTSLSILIFPSLRLLSLIILVLENMERKRESIYALLFQKKNPSDIPSILALLGFCQALRLNQWLQAQEVTIL